jgi:hypothetical protein
VNSGLSRPVALSVTRWLLFILWLCLTPPAAEGSVQVELVIPPAETHVIGDHTPLIWRFLNTGDQPVAFMWEGCCRLNGRLVVTAPGKLITPVLPSQALAHLFAKAEILQPGQPSEFETRISDWVQLHETGTHELQGEYTGVLPEQRPQVPADLELWRDSARTPPIPFTVMSPFDYLGERSQRSQQRQIELELAGPDRLDPLNPNPLRLTLRNVSRTAQRIVWPHHLQLWILDPKGQRLGLLPLPVDGPYAELEIAPGATLEREISFDSTRLEPNRFASYRVFVDLQAAPGLPRVPSNSHELVWDLGLKEVHRLVLEAAGGSRIGLRNPALKLLRVYVAELAPHLASLDLGSAPPQARALRDQLRFAACLKPFAPDPGRVDLTFSIPTDHAPRLTDSILEDCSRLLPESVRDFSENTFGAVLAVRRHLGWELALDVQPDPAVSLGTILAAIHPFERFGSDMYTAPRAMIRDGTTNTPPAIILRQHPIPAALVLRLTKSGSGLQREMARKQGGFFPLPQAAVFRPEEIAGAPFYPIEERSVLDQLLEGMAAPPQTLVVADPDLSWSELLDALAPFLARHMSVTITGRNRAVD